MGPAQTDRALDDPDLAIRIHHRSSRLHDALQMVSSPGRHTRSAPCEVVDKDNSAYGLIANRIVCAEMQVLRNGTI